MLPVSRDLRRHDHLIQYDYVYDAYWWIFQRPDTTMDMGHTRTRLGASWAVAKSRRATRKATFCGRT